MSRVFGGKQSSLPLFLGECGDRGDRRRPNPLSKQCCHRRPGKSGAVIGRLPLTLLPLAAALAGCAANPVLRTAPVPGRVTTVYLNEAEREILLRQPAGTADDGGFQSLLVGLQERMDASTGRVDLTPEDLERIARYAFDYNRGGWEDRLIGIFRRHLGPTLGR